MENRFTLDYRLRWVELFYHEQCLVFFVSFDMEVDRIIFVDEKMHKENEKGENNGSEKHYPPQLVGFEFFWSFLTYNWSKDESNKDAELHESVWGN